MCVAIPLKLEEIRENEGIAVQSGIRRSVRLDFIKDPKPGEYVIVHAGFAIERVKEEEALESIALAKEMEAALFGSHPQM